MMLYHGCTEAQYKEYMKEGLIPVPVYGHDTSMAALADAMKTGAKVILHFDCPVTYKMPTGSNPFGDKYWSDEAVSRYTSYYSSL